MKRITASTIIKSALITFVLCSYVVSVNAQVCRPKNIHNQFYMLVGKAQFHEPGVAEWLQHDGNIHAELGTILYFNRRSSKHLFYGLNWTILSANYYNQETIIGATQLGPQLSLKIAKGIVLSGGYQYRYFGMIPSIEDDLTIYPNGAHAINASIKAGPVIGKVEFQKGNLSDGEEAEIRLDLVQFSIGLSF